MSISHETSTNPVWLELHSVPCYQIMGLVERLLWFWYGFSQAYEWQSIQLNFIKFIKFCDTYKCINEQYRWWLLAFQINTDILSSEFEYLNHVEIALACGHLLSSIDRQHIKNFWYTKIPLCINWIQQLMILDWLRQTQLTVEYNKLAIV